MRAGPASYADVEGRPSEYGEVAKAAAISDIIFLKYPFFCLTTMMILARLEV